MFYIKSSALALLMAGLALPLSGASAQTALEAPLRACADAEDAESGECDVELPFSGAVEGNEVVRPNAKDATETDMTGDAELEDELRGEEDPGLGERAIEMSDDEPVDDDEEAEDAETDMDLSPEEEPEEVNSVGVDGERNDGEEDFEGPANINDDGKGLGEQ